MTRYLDRLSKLAQHPDVIAKRQLLFAAHQSATENKAKLVANKWGWAICKERILEDETLITQRWLKQSAILGEFDEEENE